MKTFDLRINILKMFIGKELYGYEIFKRLKAEGIEIGVGQLYKILLKMQQNGLLESRWEDSKKGPRKRLYKLGEKGKRDLDEVILSAIHTVYSAYIEYLVNLPPESNVFNTIANLSTDELKDRPVIAYLAADPSPINEQTFQSIVRNTQNPKAYIIKPSSSEFKKQFAGVTYLDGGYSDLPFKDSYVDLLFLTSIPKKKDFQKDMLEWCRVLNENGKLAILVPSLQLSGTNDPLPIGDFIEKREHQTFQISELSDIKYIINTLQNSCFVRIKETQIAHMTLIVAPKTNLFCLTERETNR